LCAAITFVAVLVASVVPAGAADEKAPPADSRRPLILAHYMPWYQARPHSSAWGWHWTMNRFDPEKVVNGRPEIASRFTPLIAPYDSGDPHVIEYHLLLMKCAGIDGVIVDWYGRGDLNDYRRLHENTEALVTRVRRLGLRFAVCYEDRTVAEFEKAGRITGEQRVAHAVAELRWAAEHWFNDAAYVRIADAPVLLSFGFDGLTDAEWSQCIRAVEAGGRRVAYFSEHRRREGAVGAFDWPVPSVGPSVHDRFRRDAKSWPHAIPVACPRFVDVYAEAGVGKSHGRMDDDGGVTFREQLRAALTSECPAVQLCTWNDWGEGTVIEPSREFGYRDLESVQSLRRAHVEPAFARSADDLRLPLLLLEARRRGGGLELECQLDRISEMISKGDGDAARAALHKLNTANR